MIFFINTKIAVALNTILVKEISRFLRIWVQTLIPPAISMSLYFIVFGKLIGMRVDTMSNFTYIEYIAPGIIMMSIINNSYANVVSSFFSAKFQKHIEEMLVAPIPNVVILFGFVAGGVTRGLIVGLIVTLVALFFIELQVYSVLITFSIVLMASILFALGGLINGIFAKKFDDVSIIPTFVLTPLIYLGGVFYSIDILPGIWRLCSLFNPILYIVNTFRYGILGVSDVEIGHAFIIIGLFIIGLSAIALALLNRGIGVKT